jgi:hypothetical protein
LPGLVVATRMIGIVVLLSNQGVKWHVEFYMSNEIGAIER